MDLLEDLTTRLPNFTRLSGKTFSVEQLDNLNKIKRRLDENVDYDKKVMRKKFRLIRNSLSEAEREQQSRKIFEQIIELQQFKNAKTIFVYLSYKSEVDTSQLIKHCLNVGKNVAVPKVCNDNTMLANLIYSDTQYILDKYGIKTPVEDNIIDKTKVDLVIVPGLAFDSLGFRLGYGGGYYDRFLSDFSGISVGVAFHRCITDEILPDKFDIPVDLVVSDKVCQ